MTVASHYQVCRAPSHCSSSSPTDDCFIDQTRSFIPSTDLKWGSQVHAALIVVLTRGGSTARLVAKYRPSIPVLTVAVPVLTTDSLTWTCSGEGPARQCLVTRGLLPVLSEGAAKATDMDTTEEILAVCYSLCLDPCGMVLSSAKDMSCIDVKSVSCRFLDIKHW